MRGLLNLIRCEFWKLKRKMFVQLVLAASFLFPIPLTAIIYYLNTAQNKYATQAAAFDALWQSVIGFGMLLLLPCILGIVAALLFFMERDNDTLKNLLVIPISKTKILFSKLGVLLGMSVLYSVVGLGASLVGGLIVGNINDVPIRLAVSALLGVFVLIATLPVIMVILVSNRSYIFSIILSFAYAVISFAISMMFGSNPEMVNYIASILPIPLIMKWCLGALPVEDALSYILVYCK